MTLRLIQPPTTLPVSVALMKANGRIETNAEDALVELYIRAALAYAERYCSRAFEPQTWEVVLDAFPDGEIEVPLAPITSIDSVRYDTAEGEVTIDAENYEADLNGWVVPVSGYSWPTAMSAVNAVRVRFVAGAGTPDDVKIAVLLLAEHYYENRAASGEKVEAIPFGVEEHLTRHRRLFV